MARRDLPATGGRNIGVDTHPVGGQEVLAALRGTRNNIRGKDKKKHMTPWEKEERVWEDAETGFYISSMTTAADLAQEAKLQGHCGGAHFRFIDAKVTYLYSLRDKDGVPKATIHFKPIELIGKAQPLDKFRNDKEHGNPHKSYQWLTSTSYDGGHDRPHSEYPDFLWEERPCRILTVSGRGVWATEGKAVDYKRIVREWLQAHPLPGTAVAVRPKAEAVPA